MPEVSTERLTKQEALGIFGGDEGAFAYLYQQFEGEIQLMDGGRLSVKEVDGVTTYELTGTEEQIRCAFEHHGGRQKFAEKAVSPVGFISQEEWNKYPAF